MVIKTTKSFEKQYAKLNDKVQKAFKSQLAIFIISPFDTRLHNHALKGKYLGYRSIDVNGDIRALYTVRGDIIIIFGFIGSHSQLY
jgi:addiction module RelE/StbE family toxin